MARRYIQNCFRATERLAHCAPGTLLPVAPKRLKGRKVILYRQSDWTGDASADGEISHVACLCHGTRSNVHDNHHDIADQAQRVRIQTRVVTSLAFPFFGECGSARARSNRDQTYEKTGPRVPLLHPTTP